MFGIMFEMKEKEMIMKEFFIYTVAENKMVGRVYANDWVDARTQAAEAWNFSFVQIFACEKPLPTK